MMCAAVIVVLAVTAMHKEVHERARQEQQVRENPKQVRSVFGKHEEGDDCQEDEQYDASSRTEPTAVG